MPDDPAGQWWSASTDVLPRQVFLDAPNQVSTPDFGELRDVLNLQFTGVKVQALDDGRMLCPPRISAVHLGRSVIGYVRPGTTISVDPGDPAGCPVNSAYYVNMVINGCVVTRSGGREMVGSPQTAAVLSPIRNGSLPCWDGDAEKLFVTFAQDRVEEELSALLGRPVVKPIDFRLDFPVGNGPGRRWTAVLSALLQAAGTATEPGHPHHLDLLERTLISGLLLTQPHSYTEQLSTAPTRPGPRGGVDRVVEEIRRAPDRGYTLGDLARLSGMSARSLQYAFRERYDLSPMQYLRHIRLDRAHHDLREGLGSVAEVGAYWGFTNPGRFARAYRTRFGEFPGATLKRRGDQR